MPQSLQAPVAGSLVWCEFPSIQPLPGRVLRVAPSGALGVHWQLSPPQRRQLIAALFSQAPQNVAGTRDFRRALVGLWGRLRNPDARR